LYLTKKDLLANSDRNSSDCKADLPPEAPLSMPVQDFARRPADGQDAPLDYFGPVFQRRMYLITGSFLLGLLAAHELFTLWGADGIDIVDVAFFLLFFGLFAWISFGFLNALAGFFVLLARGRVVERPAVPLTLPKTRTAVLLPIYNEDITAVSRRLESMIESVRAVGAHALFDFFILSDSHESTFAGEYLAFRRLRAHTQAKVYYRRRPHNIARKPGNIADWVRRFGAAYEHMIVLDADSLMSGPAMVRLATAMEARPTIGLLQTVPALLNGQTMFARWHQFAAALYGPIGSVGLRWWSGTEATFWGHNAILRVRAFAESCGLPELESGLLGGHIMSHDMVEAALLRRCGWAVHMVTLSDGSYEEFPPTMVDYAVRDRRWCQGNLQHLHLLRAAGFHWVSRLQLLMGASAYLTSPLWLLLLVLGMVEQLRGNIEGTLLLSSGWLLGLTAILLFGPKFLALLTLSFEQKQLVAMGGWRRVVGSTALEIVVSIAAAPVTMLSQTMAIADILRGTKSGWMPQRRSADGLDIREVIGQYRWHVGLGVVMLATVLLGVPGTIWSLPVALGLAIAPVTVWGTARADVGRWLISRGLFLSPAEQRPFERARASADSGCGAAQAQLAIVNS
jgi:membrane glycosyltransferase